MKNFTDKKKITGSTGYNRRLAQWLVQCSADTFVVNQTLVLRINICGENRHLRQAPERCGEIRSAPFATTFARITSASCAAASRTSHNKQICKIPRTEANFLLGTSQIRRTVICYCNKNSVQYEENYIFRLFNSFNILLFSKKRNDGSNQK